MKDEAKRVCGPFQSEAPELNKILLSANADGANQP
jgi:hypothetical protein